MRLPLEHQATADVLSIEENPANGHQIALGGFIQGRGETLSLVLPRGLKWQNARVLRVKILNGTDRIKAKIRQYANVWTEHANITFQFVDSGNAEIRINIDSSGNSWSYVGTDNLSIPQTRPTMNFGWLTNASSEAEFFSLIIHEFGHAMGCIHEHRCPVNAIPWNVEAVYEDPRGAKLFHVASFNTTDVRPWDKPEKKAHKRMLFPTTYDSPPKLVVGLNSLDVGKDANIRVIAFADNISTSSANVHIDAWSDTDLYSAGCAWFPVPSDDPDFQVGEFSTTEDHPVQNPQRKTSGWITFERAYASPPKVVVCLNELDMDRGKNWRVKATTTHVTTRGFILHLDTWSDTVLYSAKAAWIAYPSDKPGIVSGSFNTQEVRPPREPQLSNFGRVFFPCGAFRQAPTVFLAFDSLDVDAGRNLRLRLRLDSVSDDGLSLHIDGWADTILYSAGASYIAFA
ncbi:hypothetical protein V8D89_015344 [Ganoderma adspersum]